MINYKKINTTSSGFTIIELMISITVLSVILLMASVIIINVGHLFYKGVSTSRIQDNTRSIADDIAQRLQYTDQVPNTGAGSGYMAYCIGETRFTYVLFKQIVTDTPHVLWRDTLPSGTSSCVPAALNVNPPSSDPKGVELITSNARLTNFSISLSSPYTVNVSLAYGDNDLICDNGQAGDCSYIQGESPWIQSLIAGGGALAAKGQITCKGQDVGQQFCATSNLSITVSQRLTGS